MRVGGTGRPGLITSCLFSIFGLSIVCCSLRLYVVRAFLVVRLAFINGVFALKFCIVRGGCGVDFVDGPEKSIQIFHSIQ